MALTLASGLEILAVLLGLAYLILMIQQNIGCWLFGILSSLISIYLFIGAKLYSEAILYSYYVLIGFYGWYVWSKPRGQNLPVQTWDGLRHFLTLCLGLAGSWGLGYFFDQYSDADYPYADAGSTVFSFIASYMEAHKVLSGWIFWILINAFSVGLYSMKSLYIYAGLMVIYTLMSFMGYASWLHSYRETQNEA